MLDVINVPPLAGLVAVAALPEQLADEPLILMPQVPEASPPVLVGTFRFVRASAAVAAPVPGASWAVCCEAVAGRRRPD